MKLGDTVIVIEKGNDYGKMCTIIEDSDKDFLPVRVRLINPHDSFDFGPFAMDKVLEKWMPKKDLKVTTRQ